MRSARSPAVVRVLYTDAGGTRRHARTLEPPKLRGTTKLLVGSGARLELVEAKHSSARKPGTWSRVVEPAS